MNNDPLKGLRGEAETIAALELENQSLTRRLEEVEENLENSRILQRDHLANSIAKGKQLTALRTAAEGVATELDGAIKALEYYGPSLPEGHVCGPEAQCDGLCQDVYYFGQRLERMASALAALRAELDQADSNASNSPTASRESQG